MVKKNTEDLRKTPFAAQKKDKTENRKLSEDQNLNSANLEIDSPATFISEKTFPIVGIGASAGGLEAFSELLNNLPYDTGMAYILVQHLAPKQHSILAELLLRTTKMPVEEITDKMKMHPNHVYVIQPGTNIALFNGIIHIMPRTEVKHRPYTSIDFFLRSLAEDQRSKSIGVVLSGTGSDGVDGLKAIKAEGGITFAQHPQSSKYDAMPKAAINAGVVDFILSPQDIARELTRLGKHPYVAQQPAVSTNGALEYTEDALRDILMLLRSDSGVDFSYYKKNTLMRRIDRRMVVYNKNKLEDYLDFLRQDPKEIRLLFHDILITVTRFFRDPEAYKSLAHNVYPAITQNKRAGERIRVWISGCSSGEEAYSIAISFLEFTEQLASKPSLQIFATDINEMALEKARKGIYPESIESDVSQTRLNRFFTKVPDGYQINAGVRESCIFARHDIIKDPPLSNMDLISSRNLLIYLGLEVHNKVIPMFHYSLKPNGFILLGPSETVGRFDDLFKPVDSKQKIYAKKPLAARRGLPPDIAPSFLGTEQAAKDTKKKGGKRLDDKEIKEPYDPLKQADDIILSKYSPPGVIIDEDMQILKFRGRTGVFLEPAPGRASLNLLNMARHGIGLDLRILIQKAKETGSIARKQNIRIKHDNDIRSITLEAVPLQNPAGYYNFLILFMEEPSASKDKRTGPINIKGDKRDKTKSVDIQHELLKKELDDTKEYLRSVIQEKEATNEELRAANEELQSSTEELQSINEELEAAKEELQSSNEELTTLNEELKTRNSELTQLSDDLKNILNSVNIPIIMLDNELRIRSITPLSEKLLNLAPSDIGQKITKLKLRFDIAGLKDIVQNSIDSLTLNEQEIQDIEGRWFSLRVRPYVTMEKQIEGAVMSFIDINDIKRNSQIIEEARDFSESIVETVREPLIVLDSNLRVITTNPAFYRTFQTLPEETIGRHIYDIGNHQWDMPPLRNLIEKVLTSDNNFEDFVVEHEFPKIGHKIMLLNARKIERRTEGDAMLLLAIEDITERRRQENELLKAKDLSDALNDINAAISSTLNFDTIMQNVVKQGAEAIGCDSAAVELIEDDLPSVKYIYNLQKDILGKKLSGGQTFIDEKTNKQPVAISDVSTNRSLDVKLMQQNNIRSLLGVPLMVKNQILGTLFFLYNSKITNFDRLLIDFCEKLAVTVALSLESARLYETQSSIANILQETLLTAPPKIEGIETGSAYKSATKMPGAVGGDFYDIFRLENDKLAITIGDVAGKGIEAAKLTGLTKNTIRAYAKYDYSPASILTKTCEAICETMKPSSFITIFFGILSMRSGALNYCSAGHPPAIIKRASLDVDMLETRSPALISLESFKYVNSKSQLDKGDILVLYTDGITEARRDHEFYSEEKLLDFIRNAEAQNAEKLCESIFNEALSFTGGKLADDIAVLTVSLIK